MGSLAAASAMAKLGGDDEVWDGGDIGVSVDSSVELLVDTGDTGDTGSRAGPR